MAIPRGFGGRDYPDFGVSKSATRDTRITDLSELSVRLGSLSWFDRLGNVLLSEGFETGLSNWIANAYPAGAFPVLASTYYAQRPYSAKLLTTTDVGSYSGMSRLFPFPYFSNFGVEVHFKPIQAFDTLYWVLTFYTGTYAYYVQPVIDYDESELQLLNSSGAYEYVADLDIKRGVSSPFHVLKVTVNLDSEKYLRLLIDDKDYDVSDISIRKLSNSSQACLSMLFYLKPVSTVVNIVYVDNVIFTINEPEV